MCPHAHSVIARVVRTTYYIMLLFVSFFLFFLRSVQSQLGRTISALQGLLSSLEFSLDRTTNGDTDRDDSQLVKRLAEVGVACVCVLVGVVRIHYLFRGFHLTILTGS